MHKVLIWGAGRSGMGAAKLAYKNKEKAIIYDDNEISIDKKADLNKMGFPCYEKVLPENILNEVDLVIKSPGISRNHLIVETCRLKNIPIISEMTYAERNTSAQLIGITGSNGKTTTSLLLYHILKECGEDVVLAGNIGYSFSEAVATYSPKWFVLEVSNMQLLDMDHIDLKFSCITNITPDHLDVHKDFDEYVETKFKIINTSRKYRRYLCYNSQDKVSNNYLENYVDTDSMQLGLFDYMALYDEFSLPKTLVGGHNKKNVAAAGSLALILGLRKEDVQKAIDTFAGVEHRIQFIEEKNGVRFYNDSKATNIDSARVALESFEKNVIWICGGIDKGNDYSKLKDLVRDRVKEIICLTKYPEKIVKEFGDSKPIFIKESVEEAVDHAKKNSVDGDVVLLSPACASFDLFKNYEDRGRKFCDAVKKHLSKSVL